MTHVIVSHRTALLVGTILLLLAAILMFAMTGHAHRVPIGQCSPNC